ncbi:MAG TPA: GerMN domain-containing protein [Herpetosiphonaceae bacterium]|nr:GerMN domain-containing protein [Herpetosiphonaceae bacterium]
MPIRHLSVIAAIVFAIILAPVRDAFAHELCFAGKTAYCLKDPFSDYWENNGALPVFGYPITAAALEENADTGQPYNTQWVERTRLEDHPENAGTPYRVLLGLLGKERLLQLNRNWASEPREGAKAGCLWFAETGLNVCDQANGLGFKTYWESHGLKIPGLDKYARSLQLFGLPLTAPRLETNSSGDTVLTQWFERARFEWHPNNPNEFKVLLGLLGSEVLANRPATVSTVKVHAIAIGQGNLGCGDKLVALDRQVPLTTRPLAAAMKQLLAMGDKPDGTSTFYNALAQSALSFDSAAIDAQGVATINLIGELRLSGVCDAPRISEQLRATALQFPTIREARFFVNGVALEQLLSSR